MHKFPLDIINCTDLSFPLRVHGERHDSQFMYFPAQLPISELRNDDANFTKVTIGVILQGTCVANHNVGQFMGGRFFMGMGVSLIASAGPCYVIEISHPAYRGIVTGLYNVFW